MIRDERVTRSLTQAQLAREAEVSREWLIGVEHGNRPRAELTKILSVLSTLDLSLSAGTLTRTHEADSPARGTGRPALTTEDATRRAIASLRDATAVPAVAADGQRSAQLLRTAIDPALATHIARLSTTLVPPTLGESPGESSAEHRGDEDGQEVS